ncbi:putative disease resistance protein RGA3 [Papaver somniferum]|uniref:putative disease resistance protein RGA3 n=1 Tax=Papaver somniferum TaxID=3469 RepID=UPI000E705BA8|nr:putative disease resistance protein RGA3 [Papaver somniferum]
MAFQELIVSGSTELLKNLTSVVSQQISEVWSVHDDLKKLKGTVEMIAAVTTDAEKQQEKSEVVKLLLKWLMNVVYDADDVLDEFSYKAMREFEMRGAQGSRVLVTTRSHTVASVVKGDFPQYMLGYLPDSVCWSIIKTKAFSPGGALETPNMTCIGEIIARNCSGLPLAAKVLGNVMRLHKTETDWLSIRDHHGLKMDDAKMKIVSILKLPSHVKHDLAISVSSIHDFKIVNSRDKESFSRFRRLKIVLDKQDSKLIPKNLEKTKNLRSIFSHENDHLGEHLLHCKNLRVVCLLRKGFWASGWPHFKIQSSTLEQKHLRYLDLSQYIKAPRSLEVRCPKAT